MIGLKVVFYAGPSAHRPAHPGNYTQSLTCVGRLTCILSGVVCFFYFVFADDLMFRAVGLLVGLFLICISFLIVMYAWARLSGLSLCDVFAFPFDVIRMHISDS